MGSKPTHIHWEKKLCTSSTNVSSQELITPFSQRNITTRNTFLHTIFFPCIRFNPHMESSTQQSTVFGGKTPKLYVKPLTVQEKLTSGTTAEKLYSPMWAICIGMKTALSYSSGFFPTCNFSPAAVQVLQWLERQVPFVCDWGLNPLFLHSLQA